MPKAYNRRDVFVILFFGIICYIFYCLRNPPVAQSVEQLPFKQMVVGSIPTGRTAKFYSGKSMAKAPAPERRRDRTMARSII